MAGGIAASLVAGGVMVLARQTLQVRTVPERAIEAILLGTPPYLFEATLHQFGFDAKRYALVLTSGGMLAVLSLLGAWALARQWSVRAIVLLGLSLWLLVMLAIMPLSGAGLFAVDLVNGMAAAVGMHATVALAYAATLAAVSARELGPAAWSVARPTDDAASVGNGRTVLAAILGPDCLSRRSALLLSAGAVSAFLGTVMVVRWGPRGVVTRVVVLEPEPPTGVLPTATVWPVATPTVRRPLSVGQPLRTPAIPATAAVPTPTAVPKGAMQPPAAETATPAPETASVPNRREPPPVRPLARDKDGAALSSSRRPGELAEPITATEDFYVVSKNAVGDPFLQLGEWHLRVDGDVQRSIEIDYDSLLNVPPIEVTKTLECISNLVSKCELAPFGCDLIGTARWRGARLSDIIALAGGMKPGVSTVLVVAADDFTTALPIEVSLEPDTLLVYAMNEQTLSREHGYPARVLVPGRYGMKSAKWVTALRPVARQVDDWYGQRNWSKDGVVKTMSRIDTPARDVTLPPGTHRVAGIAYAGSRGIQRVELSADGGERWQVTQLLERPAARDAWVRWESQFVLRPGTTVTLMARATDGMGDVQVEAFSLPQPDGSSGWPSIEVRATSP